MPSRYAACRKRGHAGNLVPDAYIAKSPDWCRNSYAICEGNFHVGISAGLTDSIYDTA